MTADDPNRVVIQGIVLVLLLAPLFPIGVAWADVVRRPGGAGGRPRAHLALLVLLTASELLLLAGLFRADVLGADYSPRRFVTIGINLVAMAASTVVAARTDGPG